MKLLTRLVLLIATVGALGGLGVLAGRLLRDEAFAPTPTPSTQLVQLGAGTVGGAASVIDGRTNPTTGDYDVADILPTPDRMIPVIAPIAVAPAGADETTLDAIQASFDNSAEPAVDPESNLVPAVASAATPVVIGATPAFAPIPDDLSAIVEVGDISPERAPGLDSPTTTSTGTAPASTASAGTAPAGPPDTSTSAGTSDWFAFYLDTNWLESIGPILFDPCAGTTPGSTPLPSCPEGYAATFSGALVTPPPPFMFMGNGYYVDDAVTIGRPCPSTPPVSDGTAELTMYTHTPLTSSTFEYRRYGTADAWTTVDVGGSDTGDVDWWNEQLAAVEFDFLEHMLKTCFAVPRDPATAYEYRATGIDIFGRPVALNTPLGLIPPDDPTQRPPTTADIRGLSPVATVQSWSLISGSVDFAARPVHVDDDFSCATAVAVDDASVRRGGELPRPYGFFDPAYSRGWQASVPLAPGSSVLICATVHPDDNPLRSTATDRLVLTSPSQELPRVVVQKVGRFGGATIPEGIQVQAGSRVTDGTWDGCSGQTGLPELPPNQSTTIDRMIWECSFRSVPTDASGHLDLPIRVMRDLDPSFEGRRIVTTEQAIPIQISSCEVAAGCRGPEWYEIPIPMERRGLCGSSFGLGCEMPTDGVILVRVEYPVVSGGIEAAGSIRSLDSITPADLGVVPQLTAPDFAVLDGLDPFHADARITVTADRPVQVTFQLREETPGVGFAEPCRTTGGPSATSEGFSERPTVTVEGLCAGRSYAIEYRVVTEDGSAFDLTPRGWYAVPSVAAPILAELTTNGGTGLADLGYFYRIRVSVEGTSSTSYWWNSRSPLHGSSPACLALRGTTFFPNGDPPRVAFVGPVLDVSVEIEVTSTGNGDCGSGSGRTGLGVISFTAQVTQEQLLSGERIIVSSPGDLPLQMDLALTVTSPWRPL